MFINTSPRIFTIQTIKHLPKENSNGRLCMELEPVIQVSRIFGLAPVTVKNAKWTLTKLGLFYSALCFAFYSYVFIDRVIMCINGKWEYKLKFLYITIVVATGCCIVMDFIFCILGNKKLQAYVNNIRRFDTLMKPGNKATIMFIKLFWTVHVGLFIFLLPISVLTYMIDLKPILGAFTYFVFCEVLLMGILKFLAFTILLLIRFREFNDKLEKDITFLIDTKEKSRRLNWHGLWKKHKYLIEASKKLNSKYSFQLLLWFSVLSLNSILQIYELLKGNRSTKENVREMLLAVFFILLLTALASICHFTATEAKQMGRLLSSPEYCQECNFQDQQIVFSIGQYFQCNDFNFSACNFFNINLGVLLTIASAIVTYLVILM
ncbi:uncharacterized protein LOC122506533 [Leptopilina heterotoma]|uniref:uncharacterized protein LOC122506533 n=1 Tax=Leptopilina heterotoma TaxID=63436 RepID=UPI001CA8721A|nr:uncharacterized protein LOC122506533 [Leptopilina heterotoma]